MSFWETATLTLKNDDDFRRVSEFVKPDESDTTPQTNEEYRQLMDFVEDTLQGPERCAWMTRHCARLYVEFNQRVENLELSWSGRNEIGGWAEDIAESVVAQFPNIEFRISSGSDWDFPYIRFGVSEQGKIKWLELNDDIYDMIGFGIDVDPYVGPTPEQLEELHQHRRARVQEMIDLGVHISPDTWPPSKEQFDEEHRLRYGDEQCIKHRIWSDSDDFMFNDDDVVNMIADEYADIGLSKVELLEAGKDGMTKAREHYDAKEHGSCFYAYADSWVRQAIIRAADYPDLPF